MKRVMLFSGFFMVAIVLALMPAVASAQRAGSGCPAELAQARGHLWAVQAARDVAQGPTTGAAGSTIAALPTREQGTGALWVSDRTRQQFTALKGEQELKGFLSALSEQERQVLHQSLSGRDRNRLAASVPERERKSLSVAPSAQDAQAWAKKVAPDPAKLDQAIQEASKLLADAQALCAKGDMAGATAMARRVSRRICISSCRIQCLDC